MTPLWLRPLRPCALLGGVLALLTGPAPSAAENAGVLDPAGAVTRSLERAGSIDHPPGASPAQTSASSAATDAAAGAVGVEQVHHRDPETGRHVDPEGRIDDPAAASSAQGAGAAPAEATPSATGRVTIDRMSFGVTYSDSYSPSSGLVLFGPAKTYFLSDGTSWRSGAGTYYRPRARFDRAEVVGTTIRYTFDPPSEGFVYQQTDYDAGDHSSNGSLGAAGPLVLEAQLGSSTGTMSGDVEILSNVPANYSEPRFKYWAAPVGSIVPFEVSFTLRNGVVFDENTFDAPFTYSNDGEVDFSDPSSTPPLSAVEVIGSAQVGAGSTVQYHAVATYESGARLTVTEAAEWSVDPSGAASIEAGALSADPGCAGVTLEIRASFSANGDTAAGSRSVECREVSSDEWAEYWETYQGDERHSGYVPVSLEPEVFGLLWQKTVAPGASLNPVTAADGKVFVSLFTYFGGGDTLFALDARDGEVLWSRDFGSVFSVNPPAYGYGNVYIQTGNHSRDTYLHALEAETGAQVFQSPHAAQWERYYAPTVYDGKVYVNGGYYGGMYAFDAFSGQSLWFHDLPQYDDFTPAVDAERVYAYVGEYSPGLYVADRETGERLFVIHDPAFDWRGWSMDLAPVLGSMDDVIAIHNGRLLRFDLADRRIGLEIPAAFSGQPSVAKEVIYAINGGALEARDEASGGLVWSWRPPAGALEEHLIVTDTHVLAHTREATYAVEILSGESPWSFPAAGHMALGEETLYIASSDGVLTAISLPEYTPAAVVGLDIEGPVSVEEFSTAAYQAWVHYDDGRVRRRTRLAEWSLSPTDFASIDEEGGLSVGELLVPSQAVTVSARYREGEVEVGDALGVTLGIGVSLEAFVSRNASGALAAKRRAIAALEEAALREEAAIRVVDEQRLVDGSSRTAWTSILKRLRAALFWASFGKTAAERGAAELEALGEEGRDGSG